MIIPSILRYSRVEQHPSTSSVANKTSTSRCHDKSSFWKWRPFGKDNNLEDNGIHPYVDTKSQGLSRCERARRLDDGWLYVGVMIDHVDGDVFEKGERADEVESL